MVREAPAARGAVRGYRSVAAALRARIAAGEVQDGRLPAEAVLVAEFGVARDTVRRALSLLVDEGLVRTTHGRGHFVVSAGDDDAVGVPRYQVVAGELGRRIASGRIAPGGLVPSEATVQAEFAVSRTTARRALAELEGRGVIERRGGRRYVLPAGGRGTAG